jgi:hypothetical protein
VGICRQGVIVPVEQCPFACVAGACGDPCEGDGKTYLGCGFVALDLDNSEEQTSPLNPPAQAQPFAVTVSNPWDFPVEVTIVNGSGATIVAAQPVEPLALRTFALPRLDVDNTALTFHSYLLSTSAPVTAHQFNPENNANVYSNDASLLLPISALGSEYVVLGWPTQAFTIPIVGTRALRSFMVVAAVSEGETRVTVALPASTGTAAGPGVPAIPARGVQTFTMTRGQVLSLTTPDVDGADLTGARVSADRPVAVFAGSEYSNVPFESAYADHLEEQLFPVEAWGSEYVAAKFARRGTEPDIYRVLALENGTLVETTPPQEGASGVILQGGQLLEFRSDQDFVVTGSGPLSVAQFMVGSAYPGQAEGCYREGDEGGGNRPPPRCAIPSNNRCIQGSGIGDPAMLMLVPDRQFRSEYVVLTPRNYQQDWLTVVAPTGARVSLDGAEVRTAPDPMPGTGWEVYRLAVQPGVHRVAADQPVGLYAYGYDCDVSYAYAGGLDLGE